MEYGDWTKKPMKETGNSHIVVDEKGTMYLQVQNGTTLVFDESVLKARIAEMEEKCPRIFEEKQVSSHEHV